ncbi:SusC/RagA family TonB-linked outer membrane protein [Membranicola marinus]|uniref:SusC/RagA family TonB-linked outer membrane protein n=1 Tax=Membranihabitans marinus TaxID=1227546 RepID=A0A953HZR9_9BACT|nr:SusC/RagA family TonB-linked outer membrane protein [Membranihabitans marinus]MBY5958682.1 SusC/RagA family TonB-linked outer membrane protein [Membranihabitans marinus]
MNLKNTRFLKIRCGIGLIILLMNSALSAQSFASRMDNPIEGYQQLDKSIDDELSRGYITVSKALDYLKQRFKVNFSYLDDLNSMDKISTAVFNEKEIRPILNQIFRNTRFQYKEVEQGFYVIYHDDYKPPSSERTTIDPPSYSAQEKKSYSTKRIERLSANDQGWKMINKLVFSVEGSVTDESGEPLIGVNVLVKGTNKGTSTDFDGRFTLEDIDENAVLLVSYVGYQSKEVAVNGRANIDIKLMSDAQMLEELVVVGYGTQKKENLTGSVDVVGSERLENRSAGNVADLIKGASPNLNISMNFRGGEPGATSGWNIRGMGSIHGNASPLILVDGVEMNINNVDPESIESVSILKDASASAIYGSRAPFGVILITTKTGGTNKDFQIQYSNNLSMASPMKVPSFIDALTWSTAYNQANANAGLNPVYSEEQVGRIRGYIDGTFPHEYDPENPIDNIWAGRRNGNANNDWPQIMMKDHAFNQKHNVNVSGGNEKNQYYFSGGFTDQNGMYEHGYDFYKRYNFLTNFSSQLTDWLSFHTSVKYANGKTDYPLGETTVGREHFFREILMFAPMMPFYNINGTVQSPLVRLMQDSGRDKTETSDFFLTLGGEIEPIEGWKTKFSYNNNKITGRNAVNPHPVWVELGTGEFGNIGKPSSTFTSVFSENTYTLINALTSYETSLGGHFFKAMVGYEQEEKLYHNLNATGSQLITDEVPSISTSLGEKTVDDRSYHWATQGVFGRLNYNFDEKYLFEFSARYNGSSRFAKESRWGFFPSASVGYNISKEPFWAGIEPYVNSLKIRSSYGSLGNQNVSNYLYLSTIPVSSELNWILDQERPAYSRAPGLISDDLTWETITTFNFGLDVGVFENKLQLVFDWYDRVTTDMLGPSESLPYLLGASTPRSNNAEMATRGFELVLNWTQQTSSSFSYNASFSIGDNRSKIRKYKNDKGLIGTWYDNKDVGEIWGFETDGIIQSEDEIIPDQSKYYSSWGPGDMKYKDLNGDGILDDGSRTLDDHGDLVVIGNSTARYNIGLTGGINWKNLDFQMFWQGIGKRDYYPHVNSTLFWGMTRSWASSGLYKNSPALDYWRPADESNSLGPNTNAYFPKPYFTSETNKNRLTQSKYVLNAAYLRLKNLQIGYSIPSEFMSRLFLQKARIYVSGENLLTFSKLPDIFDPETAIASDPSYGGYLTSGVIYPMTRTLSLGVNITFK